MGEEEKGRQRWLSPLCCSILLLHTHTPHAPTPLSPVPDSITQSQRLDQSQRSRARVTSGNSAVQQQKPKQRFDALLNDQVTNVHTYTTGEGEGFRTQHAVGDKLR